MAVIAALEQQAGGHAHPHGEFAIQLSIIGFAADAVGTEIFANHRMPLTACA
jgi:hypothetical protein